MDSIKNMYYNIDSTEADEHTILQRMTSDVTLTSSTILLVISGTIVCSVGLNKNLISFIIGAKLMAPFLNTVMCIGYGLATYDYDTVKKGARSFVGRILLIIMFSTLYFVVTPLRQPSEVITQFSNPDIFDFLVAFFGGLVGVISITRKQQNNANIGVGIAVTLLPPLCIIGYAIANLSLAFFAGALYLFLINCFFIIIATFGFCKLFDIESPNNDNYRYNKFVYTMMWIYSIIICVPITMNATSYTFRSVILTTTESNVIDLINDYTDDDTIALDYNIDYENNVITINLLTDKSPDEFGDVNDIKDDYGLDKYEIDLTFGLEDYFRYQAENDPDYGLYNKEE